VQSRLPIRTRRVVVVLAAAAALAIAGCGDDDDTTDTSGASGATGVSGTALSEDEFVSRANAICADANSRIEGLQAPTDDPQSIADFAQEGLAIVEPALGEFRAIVPPADLQDRWDEFLQHAEQQIELEKQLQTAAEAGDVQEVKQLVAQLGENEDDSLATGLGLDECAKDAQPQG
jgi:hypothetical protein